MIQDVEEAPQPPRRPPRTMALGPVVAFVVAWPLGAFAGEEALPQVSEGGVAALLAWVLMALGFSFLCSVSEATLLSITPAFTAALGAVNPRRAALIKRVRQDELGRSLAGILTLNTIANTAGAVGAGAKAAEVFGSLWVGLFSVALTLAILFFSEIIPKTLGALYWKPLAGSVAVVVRTLVVVLSPLIVVAEGMTRAIARNAPAQTFSREELVAMAGLGERAGQLNEQESRILNNLFRFNSLKARDIMTPRPVIQALPDHLTVAEAVARHGQTPFSRLILFQGEIDHVTGFVLKGDILLAQAQGRGETPVASLVREIKSVSPTMPLSTLLEFLLAERLHIVLVTGEHGEVKGVVTLEDVVETLLGIEIVDEVDTVEDLQALARQRWAARARALGLEVGDVSAAPSPGK